MNKCKYYSEDPKIEAWHPECTDDDIHPEDIFGEYCPFCGKKIKYKPYHKKDSR